MSSISNELDGPGAAEADPVLAAILVAPLSDRLENDEERAAFEAVIAMSKCDRTATARERSRSGG
jgi:hypothetical protein